MVYKRNCTKWLVFKFDFISIKGKDNFTAEYALKDINKSIGVSEYKLLEDIPEYLQSQLPKAEDIELHIKDIEEIEENEDEENS